MTALRKALHEAADIIADAVEAEVRPQRRRKRKAAPEITDMDKARARKALRKLGIAV